MGNNSIIFGKWKSIPIIKSWPYCFVNAKFVSPLDAPNGHVAVYA